MAMELELGLALPIRRCVKAASKGLSIDLNGEASPKSAAIPPKKRTFSDAFASDNATATATLPLFVWQSAEDRNIAKSAYSGSTAPVGWPPVKPTWRNAGGGTRHVKVKMEGVAIGRKVDLSLHRSYATLLDAVDRLFFIKNHHPAGDVAPGDQDGASPATSHVCTFTYQDSDGDWMLLGDVPWETFVRSAKQLKIILSCKE